MKKQGFTLLEIMIVVAIIGLLAAIGIPAFQKARNNSLTTTKINNCRMANDAVAQYALTHALPDNTPVAVTDWAPTLRGGTLAELNISGLPAKDPNALVGVPIEPTDLY